MRLTASPKATRALQSRRKSLVDTLGTTEQSMRAARYALPTPEREAKANYGINAPVGKARVVNNVIDANRDRFTDNEMSVAMALLKDARLAESPSVVSAYNGIPIGTHGPRHGGVPDPHREAYIRYQLIRSSVHPKFRAVMEWFVNEVLIAAGLHRSVDQIGSEHSGYRHKDTAKGVGIGLLKAMLWRVDEIYARERALTRQQPPPVLRHRL